MGQQRIGSQSYEEAFAKAKVRLDDDRWSSLVATAKSALAMAGFLSVSGGVLNISGYLAGHGGVFLVAAIGAWLFSIVVCFESLEMRRLYLRSRALEDLVGFQKQYEHVLDELRDARDRAERDARQKEDELRAIQSAQSFLLGVKLIATPTDGKK